MISLPAGHLGHVAARCAVEGSVGDVADRQEVGPQASHAQLGHVGEGLTHAAAEQEAAQLLVKARHVAVSNESPRVDASEAHPVAFAQCDLRKEIRYEEPVNINHTVQPHNNCNSESMFVLLKQVHAPLHHIKGMTTSTDCAKT